MSITALVDRSERRFGKPGRACKHLLRTSRKVRRLAKPQSRGCSLEADADRRSIGIIKDRRQALQTGVMANEIHRLLLRSETVDVQLGKCRFVSTRAAI